MNKFSTEAGQNHWKRHVHLVLLLVKYGFSVLITVLAFTTVREWKYLVVSLVELATILAFSYVVLNRISWLGHLLHFLLLLLYNIQTLVMYFGGSFTAFIMLNNLGSLQGLSGKFMAYLAWAVPMLICTCIPAKRITEKRNHFFATILAIWVVAYGIACIVFTNVYSPIANVYYLYQDWSAYRAIAAQVQNLSADRKAFYQAEISSGVDKPEALPENPNIILIFVEGLSENIVFDSRGITPNISEFKNMSLSFDNYYNHSFATYRGLIGQLYSAYQYDNLDTNPLISIQSILKEKGYQTTFINTEPSNQDFTNYLASFQFDELVSDVSLENSYHYINDSNAYEILYRTVTEQHEVGQPFFTAIYTFGTHVSFDSPDMQYGDGSDSLLNRFYNTDYWFGEFFEKFQNSELAEDTILVLTTDHATYADDDFRKTFPDYVRKSIEVDKMPLYIYHQGIQSQRLDANGRNSLDLVPTLLDYLDISEPNYFLGSSLFFPAPGESEFDTVSYHPTLILSTQDGEIEELTGKEYSAFMEQATKYFAVINGEEAEEGAEEVVSATVSEDCSTLTITLRDGEQYENIWFPVWSQVDEQDDLVWYQAVQDDEGNWSCVVDLRRHNDKGLYIIHIYTGKEKPEQKLAIDPLSVFVPNEPPCHLDAEVSGDQSIVTYVLHDAAEYTDIQFAVWSQENDQDDLVWYQPTCSEDGEWTYTVKVADHCFTLPDNLIVHVYGKEPESEEQVFIKAVIIAF